MLEDIEKIYKTNCNSEKNAMKTITYELMQIIKNNFILLINKFLDYKLFQKIQYQYKDIIFDYFVAPSSSSFQTNLFLEENIINLH